MKRYFNITGLCNPKEHYMVNLDSRLAEIKKYVDDGKYFTINRGRQYGKTTTLAALERYLNETYIVISLDFQDLGSASYDSEYTFAESFVLIFSEMYDHKVPKTDPSFQKMKELEELADHTQKGLSLLKLFKKLKEICASAQKPIVLIIDEVDSASNNQVFLDFLAQLRSYYLKRSQFATFQSVILAGVHDIRNLQQKIRPDSEHKHNSPWNIAASFDVEMSFSVMDIAGMLREYENDHHTGMDISRVSQLIYDYTSGYPVLVSWICKLVDESGGKWSEQGIGDAVRRLLLAESPLFESLINKLEDSEELRNMLYTVLFKGAKLLYNSYHAVMASAAMYGFIKNKNGSVTIANRVFEMVLYEWFISCEAASNEMSNTGFGEKNQFVTDGHLNMELILEKFVVHFHDLYEDRTESFKEDDGRKLFLLYLRPIINGVGNYYIESQTRDLRRTDIIVDYLGEQFVIEMKIWHGQEYHKRGENQLMEYLDYYHIEKGYMLSFNFNQHKQIGVHTVNVGNKVLVEAVV